MPLRPRPSGYDLALEPPSAGPSPIRLTRARALAAAGGNAQATPAAKPVPFDRIQAFVEAREDLEVPFPWLNGVLARDGMIWNSWRTRMAVMGRWR